MVFLSPCYACPSSFAYCRTQFTSTFTPEEFSIFAEGKMNTDHEWRDEYAFRFDGPAEEAKRIFLQVLERKHSNFFDGVKGSKAFVKRFDRNLEDKAAGETDDFIKIIGSHRVITLSSPSSHVYLF